MHRSSLDLEREDQGASHRAVTVLPWVPISLSRERQWPFPQRAAVRNELTDVKVFGEHEHLLHTYIELLLLRLPGRGSLGVRNVPGPAWGLRGWFFPRS